MKVFIADDSRVVVERLASLLEEVPGARLVGQAGDVPADRPGAAVQSLQPEVGGVQPAVAVTTGEDRSRSRRSCLGPV